MRNTSRAVGRDFRSPSPSSSVMHEDSALAGASASTTSQPRNPTQLCDNSAIIRAESDSGALMQCSAMTQSSDANSEGAESLQSQVNIGVANTLKASVYAKYILLKEASTHINI